MNTRLFIENREIELDETVQFAITKQFEDLSNPTTIINDWSKTVSIPFTARNNEIFGHIYNPDKLIVEAETPKNIISDLPIVRVSNGVWNSTYNILTSTRTNNTSPSANGFKVQYYNNDTFIRQVQLNCITCVRKDYVSIIKNSTWNRLRIAFNGNAQDCYVSIDCSSLINGTYTLTYEVTALDTTNTGNTACVSGLYLVSGSTPVYAMTDILPDLNYTTYNANYSKETQKITSTAASNTTFVVQLFNGNSLYSTRKTQTSTGSDYVTITKNASWNRCFIGFDGHTNGIYLDFSNFAATTSFTISYYVTALGNTSGVVSNIVIVPSNSPVYWDELHPVESLTGIYFNPYKKLDMRLQWGDDVLMVGYAKMNEVKQNNGKGTYELTLFGQLGKIFQELKKITFDTTTDNTDYLIHGERYVDEFITNSLVHDSWITESQSQETIKEKGETGYNVTDIIGFAPSNASKEGFDFTTFQVASEGEGASMTFQEALEKGFEGFPTFEEVTGISPATIIPNGIYPRAIGEYRSYLQLPYIYWNKLFQIFQNKAESLTGYKFKLDTKWFNNKNPYWYDLVYMLKQFDIKDGGTSLNTYNSIGHHGYADIIPPNTETTVYTPRFLADGAFAYRYIYDGTKTQWTTQRNIPITSNHYEKTESVPLVQGNMRLKLSPNERVVTQVMQVKGVLEVYFGNLDQTYKNSDTWKGFYYSPDVVTCINLKFTGANGTVRRQLGAVLQENASSPCVNFARNCEASSYIPRNPLRPNRVPNSSPVVFRRTGSEWDFTLNFPETNLFYSEFGEYVTISLETYCWFPDGAAAQMPYGRQNYTSAGSQLIPPEFSNKYQFGTIVNFNSEMRITSGIFRSGSKFTLNDLWNKDVSLFDEILRYCKMFRIGIKVDEANKQLVFMPIERYFENYTVTDWTNKIDKSKDFTITPITFEDKYVLFNYEDGKTKNDKVYKEKYGYNYGEYRLTTDYNFNNKTNKLFEGQNPSNIISPIVLTWNTLFRENKIVYRIPTNESYVDDGDKDNKMVDTFGQFYFHNGLKIFTRTDMPVVNITDDTKLMSWNQTYFYTGGFPEVGTFVLAETYPYLSLYIGDNMITYAVPKECYVSNVSYSNKKGIYDNLWETYLNERYNIQNKKITCYVDIEPAEFSTFDWNKLVKVGNQLCIVNKIYDYDITSSLPTKVDLITIQNIEGYTTNEFLDNLNTTN